MEKLHVIVVKTKIIMAGTEAVEMLQVWKMIEVLAANMKIFHEKIMAIQTIF